MKFHFFSNYILGLRLQKLASFYVGAVILIPRLNNVIGYCRCRCSSRDQESCCLSTLISYCLVLYESGRIVDGVPKFFHENCVVIVSAGILLSLIV
jgi:hypothetical protein